MTIKPTNGNASTPSRPPQTSTPQPVTTRGQPQAKQATNVFERVDASRIGEPGETNLSARLDEAFVHVGNAKQVNNLARLVATARQQLAAEWTQLRATASQTLLAVRDAGFSEDARSSAREVLERLRLRMQAIRARQQHLRRRLASAAARAAGHVDAETLVRLAELKDLAIDTTDIDSTTSTLAALETLVSDARSVRYTGSGFVDGEEESPLLAAKSLLARVLADAPTESPTLDRKTP